MLEQWIVDEVRRLLQSGASHRQVARTLPISRGSVGLIARGRRRSPHRRAEEEPAVGPPVRCGTCGFLQVLPCRVCRDRKGSSRRPYRVLAGQTEEELTLSLKPRDHARYLVVRAKKIARGERPVIP